MLFHITHHHDEHTCPAKDDAKRAVTFDAVLDSLTDHVNEVVGAWVDPLGHDFFFVVDADETEQIFQGMFPILDAGTAQVRPVRDFAATLKARAEANA